MSKILVIETYLSKDFSIAKYATDRFIDEYKKINPNDEIIYLNLNNEKKLHTVLNANNFSEFWDENSQRYIDLLFSVDKIIIETGMINFTISPILKNFLDNILVANKTFRYKYDGSGKSEGLLNPNTKVQLIMAQGAEKGWYPFAAFDNYLESVLNFAGINKIQKLIYYGNKTSDKSKLSMEEKFNLNKVQFDEFVKNF